MNETMSDELGRLRAENARLRALLAQHGIAADEPEPEPRKSVPAPCAPVSQSAASSHTRNYG